MTCELVCISAKYVESSILKIRGRKVVLDRVLSGFYSVSISALNQAVKRDPERGKRAKYSTEELERRLDELQRTYDDQFTIVFEAIRQLMITPVPKRNPIGFRARIPKK
jgi:hypothetical protein